MSQFLLSTLIQFGEESELVDVLVSNDLDDVLHQIVSVFNLQLEDYRVQILEKKICNDYVNLSKLSLLMNIDWARLRILPKKTVIFCVDFETTSQFVMQDSVVLSTPIATSTPSSSQFAFGNLQVVTPERFVSIAKVQTTPLHSQVSKNKSIVFSLKSIVFSCSEKYVYRLQ
jgi:hypothetical protein